MSDNFNFFDKAGKFINEACSGYYSSSGSSIQGGASSAVLKALKGFTAVDTPLSNAVSYGMNDSVRGQISKQAEFTLAQRNYLLSQIDRVSGHWIAHAVKSIIASDGFNDLCEGIGISPYSSIYIRYTDETDPYKAEDFSNEIEKLLKRTSFLDILKDCVMNEGLDYCELFLSTPVRLGYGIEYVSDNLSTREHIGIYKNTNLLGAIKFDVTPKGAIRGREFIKADKISHFLMGYKKIPLAISKSFNKKYDIPEKIRCAYPILTPVIDMIIQYDQLQKLQSALEMIKATQPIVMGVGISSDNDMSDVVRQLQEWGLTLNENKNNIVGSLDTCDTSSIMQSMYNILMIPYSVDEGVNSLKQVAVDFPNSNLSEVLDDLRRSIALALGIPEQYIALEKGTKDNKQDNIKTNPRYSKMLSMIQQSLAKGIVEFIYKHLKAKYTDSNGFLTRVIEKDKIEVLFKSSTNLNDKIEDERLMLKAEQVNNMLSVIDTVAASPNMNVKVNDDELLEYWSAEMEKDPHLRNIFSKMTPEEIEAAKWGPEGPPQEEPQEEEQQQPAEEESKEGKEDSEEEGKDTNVPSKEKTPKPPTQAEQEIKQVFQ